MSSPTIIGAAIGALAFCNFMVGYAIGLSGNDPDIVKIRLDPSFAKAAAARDISAESHCALVMRFNNQLNTQYWQRAGNQVPVQAIMTMDDCLKAIKMIPPAP